MGRVRTGGHLVPIAGPVTVRIVVQGIRAEDPVLLAVRQPVAIGVGLGQVREWKHWRDLYGDIIVETYCHSIDALNWFLGDQHPLKAVAGGGRTIRRDGDMSDHVTVAYEYPGRIQATLVGSHITPPFFREVHERFYGSEGIVETARDYWKHYRDRDGMLDHIGIHGRLKFEQNSFIVTRLGTIK